jgi:hypothetical protein
MAALTPDEREAMSWVAQQTTPDARMLVVSGTPWEIDRTSEWLPVLAHRKSVATVQGYEWRPIGEFARKQQYNDLQGCAAWVSQCVTDWSRSTGQWYTHVYIPKSPERNCCRLLRYSLENDRRFREIYDGPGAVVFALRRPGALADR